MNLNNVSRVIAHDNCPDGLAAAMIVKGALPGVEIQFVQYNTPEHKAIVPQPGLMFVDFAPYVPMDESKQYDQGVLDAWGQSGSLILDHHKGAAKIAEAFGENGRFADEAANPGHSGAMLAFEHVWEPIVGHTPTVREFARLVGIRDTWVRGSIYWEEACKQSDILMFMPRERWLESHLLTHLDQWASKYAWIGDVLAEKNQKSVKKSIEGSYRFTTPKGTRVMVFDNVKTTSDACDQSEDVDLVVGTASFVEDGKVKVIYSTRARGGFDCLSFAKSLGGGGHSKAAGLNVNIDVTGTTEHPFAMLRRLVEKFES